MTSRIHLGAIAILSLAACQSVHTQSVTPSPTPLPDAAAAAAASTPGAFNEAPSPTLSPGSTPVGATPTATPTPKKPAPQLSYTMVHGVGRTIAITFDDGPSAKLTPMLLDMLKERGIKATFFVVGQNAAEYPDILKRMVAEGHEVGNHSWNHPPLTKLGMAGVDSQIQRTNAAIKAAIGHDPVVMRPPYGATSANLNRHYAQTYGMKVILWSVDPLDWKYRNSAKVQSAILSQVGPGGIILAHDIHPTTVNAMPATLDGLIAKGYKFVTVSELLAMEGTVATPTPMPAEEKKPKHPNAVTVPVTGLTPQPTPSPSASPTPSEAATEGNAAR